MEDCKHAPGGVSHKPVSTQHQKDKKMTADDDYNNNNNDNDKK